MTIALEITFDAANLRRFRLLTGASKLLAAQSLTFTAERAVPAWQAGNKSVFHLRREAFIQKGVRKRAATPGNLNAQVGTIDRFAGRHIVGVGEEKMSAARRLFVPNKPTSEQGTHTETRRQLRGYGRTKRKPFRLQLNGGGLLIVRRKGKARTPLEVLGRLEHSVDIPERLDAAGIVYEVVQREFPPIYERLLLKWAASQA